MVKKILGIYFIVLFICVFKLISGYILDYNKILGKSPKVSLNLVFDKNEDSSSHQDIFKDYLFTYEETELPFPRGQRMKCLIPTKIKINLPDIQKDKNDENKKITFDLGRIFFKEGNFLCSSKIVNEWTYKFCPNGTLTQTLRYNKIDEKTKKEVPEINVIGYPINSTYKEKYELYNEEMGTEYTSEDMKEDAVLVFSDRVVKLIGKFEKDYSVYRNNSRVIIEVTYKIKDIVDLIGKNQQLLLQFNKELENLKKIKGPNVEFITYRGEILKMINKNVMLVDGVLPHTKYQSFQIKTEVGVKDSKYITSSSFFDNKYVYCSYCDMIPCLNSKNCFVTTPKGVYQISEIYDQHLFKLSNSYTKMDTVHILWKKKDEYILNTTGIIVNIVKGIVTGKQTTFSTLNQGKSILIMKNPVNQLLLFNENNFIRCIVKEVNSNVIMKLGEGCQNVNITYSTYYFLLASDRPKYLTDLKPSVNFVNPSNMPYTSINQITKVESLQKKYGKDVIIPIDSHTLSFSISLDFVRTPFHSSDWNNPILHFYLSPLKEERMDSFEIIIDSSNGIILKEANNTKTIAFYKEKDHINFFEKRNIKIILHNNYIYFMYSKEKMSNQIKVRSFLENKIKYNYLEISGSSLDSGYFESIYVYEGIFPVDLVNIFIYNKKFLLDDNNIFVEEYINGDFCEETKTNRTTVVKYKCDPTGENDFLLHKAKETKMCGYSFEVLTKYFCNPQRVMQKILRDFKVDFSCFPENDNYNKEESDFFNENEY